MKDIDPEITIEQAIRVLKKNKIESFELMNVLVIPVKSMDELDVIVSKIAKIFKESRYYGPWRVDPYYYDNH